MSDKQIEKPKDIKEIWERLRYNWSFWALVALFMLVPITRILGI